MSPKEVLEFAKKNDASSSICASPISRSSAATFRTRSASLAESSFEEGFGIDGSSIRGWAAINESDMLLIPDPTTAFMDPFCRDADARHDLRRDRSRSPSSITIAIRAGSPKRPSCICRTAASPTPRIFGAEAEFFIFDNIRFDQNQHSGFYFIDAEEGRWNSGREREQPRLPSALQGRLLPGPADRSLSGPAQRDGRRR